MTNSIMEPNKIFNPNGNDDINHRSIWYGETTNLMQLNDVRYSWAVGLWKQMRENFWTSEKFDVTQDINDYQNLTPDEQKGYDGILSYLIFLDSIQTVNIPHLKSVVTAPEIALCMAEQTSQEALHSQSYQYLLESIIPKEKINYIYDFWKTDKLLFERCEFIASMYQKYIDQKTEESYFEALVANFILEGLYFYSGFCFFYNLASRQLMSGSADIFKMINRDELSHVRLYQKIIPEAMQTFPYSKERIYEMFDKAVKYEVLWVNHIVGNNILGITESSTEQYIKYLANIRLKSIGLEPLYTDPIYFKNCYSHLEKIADTGKEASVKANFFDSGVTSYVMSSGVEGWEEV